MHEYLSRFLTIIFLIVAAVVFRASSIEFLGHYSYAMIGGYGVFNIMNYTSDNVINILILLIPSAYIIFAMPNALEIVGYDRIKQNDSTCQPLPFIEVKTHYLRMQTNIIVSVLYATIFALTLIGVMTADSPESFIYFDF